MRKRELKRISFNDYLNDYMFRFIRKAGNHVRISETEVRLKSDVEFLFTNAPNRNDIVDEEVWSDIIYKHLEQLYN